MKAYTITYIATGSGETKKTDRVTITENEAITFETGIERPTNIIEVIEVFEMIAKRWWGTNENRNSIINIDIKEI